MEKEFTEGDAFVAAYSEYFGVVYKEALKYSGNHHIAEEIAQDAFFTAYIPVSYTHLTLPTILRV